MNREYKFRVWDSENKVMVYFPELGVMRDIDTGSKDLMLGVIAHLSGYEGINYFLHEQDIPLMQYIGRKDKSGKEIYEGDKLLFRDEEDSARDWILVVKWDNLLCGWSLYDDVSDNEAFEPFSDVVNESFEVIGNIYSNPEFLKEK